MTSDDVNSIVKSCNFTSNTGWHMNETPHENHKNQLKESQGTILLI